LRHASPVFSKVDEALSVRVAGVSPGILAPIAAIRKTDRHRLNESHAASLAANASHPRIYANRTPNTIG
jgi:hypothetical protein